MRKSDLHKMRQLFKRVASVGFYSCSFELLLACEGTNLVDLFVAMGGITPTNFYAAFPRGGGTANPKIWFMPDDLKNPFRNLQECSGPQKLQSYGFYREANARVYFCRFFCASIRERARRVVAMCIGIQRKRHTFQAEDQSQNVKSVVPILCIG